ncbi:MAG: flavin reductase [Pseudomonadota bacterium]|jgi:flavin reductase (DIM6/NTAB) family NADH-FMN oxidoreductase RutF|uniref:Flavin oxidoreductase n=1 Tax=Alteromonas genovensis TaxID=471225 RepID=A0A6N9TDH7_9ALTE|nr:MULTISPECIES: flavin reductase [Alteromonas]MAI38716.1 flavin oxidoreductase [Alteromonas sp.]MDY6885510.1 flavin reductase [Pseudomonadota bacterium]NDW15354.1 flavin oxidoreductase [Alteromonas genovensis]OUX85245.1 MAG: flavin oxidoreductase [Alteromonas sp. TMED35]|tara:strand:+ start:59035 stop:59664 length:630 start_codon:yes stop_codon:yes gene_type:complete
MTDRMTRDDLDNLEQRYRANLINSLSGFKSAVLLGTTDGKTNNLAVISSVVHIGANPPLLGMIMRPHTVQRDSLDNIKQQGFYTLNHVNTQWADKAHQTSARYEQDESEFDAVGLTPFFSDTFSAPYVKESEVNIGLKVAQHFSLLNNTEMVIGEIQEVFFAKDALDKDGYLDIEALNTASISGLDSYHSSKRLARYAYAKPNVPLETK